MGYVLRCAALPHLPHTSHSPLPKHPRRRHARHDGTHAPRGPLRLRVPPRLRPVHAGDIVRDPRAGRAGGKPLGYVVVSVGARLFDLVAVAAVSCVGTLPEQGPRASGYVCARLAEEDPRLWGAARLHAHRERVELVRGLPRGGWGRLLPDGLRRCRRFDKVFRLHTLDPALELEHKYRLWDARPKGHHLQARPPVPAADCGVLHPADARVLLALLGQHAADHDGHADLRDDQRPVRLHRLPRVT
mmetsp:Transcript_68/g.158  ORF Transcript_68/g.158 Transcript_68/m.158 type:complete len:245 (+) Transcript_68:645-1379(+)